MFKKVLSVTVALAICLVIGTVMPLIGAEKSFEGEGTKDSPYLIKDADDLLLLAETVNDGNDFSGSYFMIPDDVDHIDLSGVCGEDINGAGEVSWVPIGAQQDVNVIVSGKTFSGIFDGNGKEIIGLHINAPKSHYKGLFGYVSGGTVKNLTVNGYVNGDNYVGGVVGYIDNGSTIANCRSNVTVSGSSEVGGILGRNSGGTIENCCSTGTVSGSNKVGGIIGRNAAATIVKNCYYLDSAADIGIGEDNRGGYDDGEYRRSESDLAFYGMAVSDDTDVSDAAAVSESETNEPQPQPETETEADEPQPQTEAETDEPELDPAPEYDPPKAKEGLVYNGIEQPLIDEGNANGLGRMEYALGSDGVYSATIPTGKDAGSYTVLYRIVDEETGKDVVKGPYALPQSVEIAKANSIAPPLESQPKLTATVGQKLADIESQLPEGYAWDDNTKSVDLGTNQYKVKYTQDGDTKNYNSVEFYLLVEGKYSDPQNPTVTPPTALKLVYNGEEQQLIKRGTAVNGVMLYKLGGEAEEKKETGQQAISVQAGETEYDIAVQEILPFAIPVPYADDGYSTDIPVAVDAGQYKVWYRVRGDLGFNDIDPKSITVTIAKADPPKPAAPELTATAGQTLKDVKLPANFAWVDDTQSVGKAGTNNFAAIYTPNDTKNYNTLKLNLPVKVTEAKITPPNPKTGLVYNRTSQELITAGSVPAGTTMVYRVELAGIGTTGTSSAGTPAANDGYSGNIPTATDAGRYTVWYKAKDGNGKDITDPVALTVEIIKADPTLPNTNLTLNATVGQRLRDVARQLPEGYAWADDTLSVGSVGTNSFAATYTPSDTRNFNTLSITLNVKVTENTEVTTTTTTAPTPEVTTTTTTSPLPDVTEPGVVDNGTDKDMILSVEDAAADDVPSEDKLAIAAVLDGTGYNVGMYLNIDLIKLIDGQQVKITESSSPVSVTVKIPEALRIKNRTFALVRVHNGKAEILNDRDSDPNTVTVLSDKFSTYALIYRDSASTDEGRNPSTGIILVVAPLAAASIAVVASKKRK